MSYKTNIEYVAFTEKKGLVIVTLMYVSDFFNAALVESDTETIQYYVQDQITDALGYNEFVGEL